MNHGGDTLMPETIAIRTPHFIELVGEEMAADPKLGRNATEATEHLALAELYRRRADRERRDEPKQTSLQPA